MNFLEFANPMSWWAALAVVPVVAFYVLKTRMRRQQVSTLLFWDQLFDEKRPTAWWQQLRRLLSLLVQLVFLLLLVAALVDPLWSWQRQRQRRVVLVIDNSASMQARTEQNTTRLDTARTAARALVRSLRGTDQMAVLTAGGTAEVGIGMTDHQNSLLDAVDQVTPTDGPTAVAQALALAQRLLADFEGEGEIMALTDGAFEQPPATADGPKVVMYGVGDDTPNVGITRYQVRRSLLDAVGYQVLVDVSNFSDEAVSQRLTFTLEGDLVDVVPVDLQPNQTITRLLDHTSAEGGRLVAELDAEDAFSTDNRAVVLLPRRDPLPVVLVTEGNLFLESVLSSIPLVSLTVTDTPPQAAPQGGVLVLDRTVPEMLPPGRVLVVDPRGDCDLWALAGPIDEPLVAAVDSESPLTQHVRLTNVLFPGAQRVEFKVDAVPLISDSLEQPLLARVPRRHGDAVVLTCSLEEGDLPLRIAFPVLMKNTIEWYQGIDGELQPAVAAGEMVTVNLAPLANGGPAADAGASDSPRSAADTSDGGAADVAVVEAAETAAPGNYVLQGPGGQQFPVVTSEERVVVGPLTSTGLWHLRKATATGGAGSDLAESTTSEAVPATPGGVAIACNLANPDESDLRPRFELQSVAAQNLLTLGGYSMWYYLTWAALGLIVTEWWLYQRRILE